MKKMVFILTVMLLTASLAYGQVVLDEGFENGGAIPTGWTQEYVSYTVNWTFGDGTQGAGVPLHAHSGSYNARFYFDGDLRVTKLVTPEMDLSAITDPLLTFWHAQAVWGSDQNELRVYYKTSAGGSWTLIPGQEYTSNMPDWTEEADIELPTPSSTYYIAFEGKTYYGYSVCVDDVIIEGDIITTVTFTNGANAALNYEQTSPSPPQSNWHFGQFSLAGDAAGATLNSVSVMLWGTYDLTDLGTNPFRLYASDTNDFGTATEIGNDVADPGSGNDVTFSSLNDAIPSGTRYYWVTADISSTATGDDNINGTIDASGDLSITGGSLSGSSNYGKLNAGSDVSLPIELSSFTVQYLNNTPTLYWTTQSETDNLGWNVYRNAEENFSSAQKITNELIPGNGTTTEPSYYNFNDNDEALEIGTTYWYWLENIDLGGETHYSNARSITIPTPGEEPFNNEPPVVYLLNTAPNPMNSSTYFCFTLDKSVEATISIYNIKGELVRTLPKVWADADAESTVYWNGKDENGNRLQAGIYLYQLNLDGKVYEVKRLIVIR